MDKKSLDLTNKAVRQWVLQDIDKSLSWIEDMLGSEALTDEETAVLLSLRNMLLPRLKKIEELFDQKIIYSIGLPPQGKVFILTRAGIEEASICDFYHSCIFTAIKPDGKEFMFRPGQVGYRVFATKEEAEAAYPKWLEKRKNAENRGYSKSNEDL